VITKLDFIGIPSTDSERSRAFYVETLGLRPDPHALLRPDTAHRYAPREQGHSDESERG
jgi:catechol 2,3-dioxygenase-like lactoylglutathione lyase family enzyme